MFGDGNLGSALHRM